MNARILLGFAFLVLVLVLLSGCPKPPLEDDDSGQIEPEPEPEVDLCENISCNDKCENTTLFSGGSCVEGRCIYAATVENAAECGYEERALQLDTQFRSCSWDFYSKNFDFFFTIKNVGEVPVPENASIWIIGEGISKKTYDITNREYGINQILWGERNWSAYPYQGNRWRVTDYAEFQQFGFKLVYCEGINVFIQQCSEENGTVLFEGNTGELCEVRE